MFFTLAQRKNERDIHPLQGYALVTFFSTHPTLSYRHRGSQPIPQTPLTTSSSVTTRDSLSELGSPLAAPSVVPLQGRDLTAPPVAQTLRKAQTIKGLAWFLRLAYSNKRQSRALTSCV